VNGRKFKYLVYDNDATDTNQALANVKRLNEVDKYFAQIGGGNPFADPMYPYLEQHGVPVLGEMSEISQVYRRKNTFPTGNYVSVQCRAIGDYAAKNLGWKKVGTVATNVYISQDCKSGFIAAIKKNGGQITYESETPLGTPDFTSEAIRMRQSGAEAVAIAHTGAAATSFMQAAQRQGWRPEKGYASCSPCYAQSIARDAAQQAEGSVFAMAGRLWTSSNPGAQTMVAAVKKYVAKPSWDGAGLPAWSGTNLFVDALKAIGSDVSRSRLMGWVGSQKAWKAAGDFTLPLDFTTKGPNDWYRTPMDSVILGQVKNGDLHELTSQWAPDPAGGNPTPNASY
jgi:ABC-type branched-subunit amino acid transport system substrate-binding protein